MNTRFVTSLKALVISHQRVQVIGQILCLVVVAALFVFSPLVTLAANCGGQNNAQKKKDEAAKTLKTQAQKTGDTVQIVAVIDTFNAGTPAPDALNKLTVDASKLEAGTKLAGSVLLKSATLSDVKTGAWIMMSQNGVTYAATFFGCNNQKVCELWPAEKPVVGPDAATAKITNTGTKIFVEQSKLGLLTVN